MSWTDDELVPKTAYFLYFLTVPMLLRSVRKPKSIKFIKVISSTSRNNISSSKKDVPWAAPDKGNNK